MNVDDCQAYIANLFSDLRSLAARARAKRVAAPQDIGAFARETELVAILDMMRRHAALFDIELRSTACRPNAGLRRTLAGKGKAVRSPSAAAKRSRY